MIDRKALFDEIRKVGRMTQDHVDRINAILDAGERQTPPPPDVPPPEPKPEKSFGQKFSDLFRPKG